MFYGSGIRVSELAHLKCMDLQIKEHTLLVHGKGSKDRKAFLREKSIAALQAYLKEGRPNLKCNGSPYLFIGNSTRRLGKQRLWQIVKDQSKRLALLFLPSPLI
jgi:site-specific recombinase XerD